MLREEKDAWMDNSIDYMPSKIRYTVLAAVSTVFLPPGLVHFFFRLAGTGTDLQTLALGGHILMWSRIHIWMRVVLDQMQYLDSTSKKLLPAIDQYVRAVKTLVMQRQKTGRVVEINEKEATT